VLHVKPHLLNPVLGGVQVDRDKLPVRFEVLLKKAVVGNTAILIVLDPVYQEIGNNAIALIFCKELRSQNKVDLIGFLPEIGSRRIHGPEFKTQVERTVNIPAEFCMKIDLLFGSLFVLQFRKGLGYPVVTDTIIAQQVRIEAVVPVIKPAAAKERVRGKVAAGQPDIAEGSIEPVMLEKRVVILETGNYSIIDVEIQLSEFFNVIIEKGNNGGIFLYFQGIWPGSNKHPGKA
jgi:hypothetical protein